MLINNTVINECETKVILLTQSTHAYIVHVNDKYYLYITDIKNPRHVPELMEKFDTEEDVLRFAEEFWSERKIVKKYYESFIETEDTPATERQLETTNGIASTYGETTWYFAISKCRKRMKPIITILQSGITESKKKKLSELEKLKQEE